MPKIKVNDITMNYERHSGRCRFSAAALGMRVAAQNFSLVILVA